VVLYVWTVRQVCSDVLVSGPDVLFSAISYVALVICPDGEPLRVKSFSPLRRTTFSSSLLIFFFCRLVCFSLHFSRGFHTCSCPFAISLHPRYDSLIFFYCFLLSFYA